MFTFYFYLKALFSNFINTQKHQTYANIKSDNIMFYISYQITNSNSLGIKPFSIKHIIFLEINLQYINTN